jgi:hypothetical protein
MDPKWPVCKEKTSLFQFSGRKEQLRYLIIINFIVIFYSNPINS